MGVPNKKPTMMEVKNAINNLINEYASLTDYVKRIDSIFFDYLHFRKDEDKFKVFLEEKYPKKEESKDEKSKLRSISQK